MLLRNRLYGVALVGPEAPRVPVEYVSKIMMPSIGNTAAQKYE